MVERILFVEGVKNSPNGNLRQGFTTLLSAVLKDKKPRIIMGDGNSQTVKKFSNAVSNKKAVLLDSDTTSNKLNETIDRLNLNNNMKTTFFMVQAMESWFLSQPDILDKYFNSQISKNLPSKASRDIAKPADELTKLTRNLDRGKQYHKVKHGTALLLRLDANRLMNDFPEFKRLIEYFQNS